VVEADSDHETMGDTISRARLSQPRWNTFKHSCKRDRNPCDRPPPTGAAAKHAEGSLYHFGFSQGLIQKVHNFFKIMLYRYGASSARLRAISRSQRSPFAKSRSLS
jgi:hypothetical protein